MKFRSFYVLACIVVSVVFASPIKGANLANQMLSPEFRNVRSDSVPITREVDVVTISGIYAGVQEIACYSPWLLIATLYDIHWHSTLLLIAPAENGGSANFKCYLPDDERSRVGLCCGGGWIWYASLDLYESNIYKMSWSGSVVDQFSVTTGLWDDIDLGYENGWLYLIGEYHSANWARIWRIDPANGQVQDSIQISGVNINGFDVGCGLFFTTDETTPVVTYRDLSSGGWVGRLDQSVLTGAEALAWDGDESRLWTAERGGKSVYGMHMNFPDCPPPDLHVTLGSMEFYPDNPLSGEETVISARVMNVRLGTAPFFKVGFFDSNPDAGGTFIDEVAVDSLVPGEEINVSTTWYPDGQGTHEVYVVADWADQMGELREDNNSEHASIEVGPPHRPVWHVSPSGDDYAGDGSEEMPFRTIQKGIDVSLDGDTVLVAKGVYEENINFLGKKIIVASHHARSRKPAHIQQTIIRGTGYDPAVLFESGEDSTSVLHGFTIRHPSYEGWHVGVVCDGAAATIERNIIDSIGALSPIFVTSDPSVGSPAIISHNTIANSGSPANGLIQVWNTRTVVSHNIMLNSPSIPNAVFSMSCTTFVGHNCVFDFDQPFYGWWIQSGAGDTSWGTNQNGTPCDQYGNILVDPMLIDPEANEFRLQFGSPCIDAGDAGKPLDPDGTVSDIGALYFDNSITSSVYFTIDPQVGHTTWGGQAKFRVSILNNYSAVQWLGLSTGGLPAHWFSISDSVVTLLPGEWRDVQVLAGFPDCCDIPPGQYPFEVEITNDEFGISWTNPARLEVIGLTLDDLNPPDSIIPASDDMVITWRTSEQATGQVCYKLLGAQQFQSREASSGEFHEVVLENLRRDTSYVWYARSATVCDTAESALRLFSIGKGVMFSQRSYQFYFDRDYDQQELIGVYNEDTMTHTVHVEFQNPYEDLAVGFTGSGSMDTNLTLPPHSGAELHFALHAQDATQNLYQFAFQLACDDSGSSPIQDVCVAEVHVNLPWEALKFWDSAYDPISLTKRFWLRNSSPDPLTDVSVSVSDNLVGKVLIDPDVAHALLEPWQTLQFQAVGIFDEEDAGAKSAEFEGNIGATAAGGTVWDTLSFNCGGSKSIFLVTIENTIVCKDNNDWYCTNRPHVCFDFTFPFGVIRDYATDGSLSITFQGGAGVKPHDLHISLNGHHIHSFIQTVPFGTWQFFFPPGYLNEATAGVSSNQLCLDAENFNPGHYVVSTAAKLCVCMDEYREYVCASSAAEAESILLDMRPYLSQGYGSLNISISKPQDLDTLSVGSDTVIVAAVAGADSIGNYQVSAYFSNGEPSCGLTRFWDDPNTYYMTWTPQIAGPCTVTVNASNCEAKAKSSASVAVFVAGKPDIVVEDITCTPTEPQEEAFAELTATVKNIGGENITDPFEVFFNIGNPDPDGDCEVGPGTFIGTATINELGIGEETGVTVDWTPHLPGINDVYVFADAELTPAPDQCGNIDEGNEANNVASTSISVSVVTGTPSTALILLPYMWQEYSEYGGGGLEEKLENEGYQVTLLKNEQLGDADDITDYSAGQLSIPILWSRLSHNQYGIIHFTTHGFSNIVAIESFDTQANADARVDHLQNLGYQGIGVTFVPDADNTFCVSVDETFFSSLGGLFVGSLLYFEGCEMGPNRSAALRDALLNKGAAAVVGFDFIVKICIPQGSGNIGCHIGTNASEAGGDFYSFLLDDGQTVGTSADNARLVHGAPCMPPLWQPCIPLACSGDRDRRYNLNNAQLTSAVILPSETKVDSFQVEGDMNSLSLTLTWSGSDLDLELETPEGIIIDSAAAAEDSAVTFWESNISEYWRIEQPQEGVWKSRVMAIDVPPEGEQYRLISTLDSPLRLVMWVSPEDVLLGNEFTILGKAEEWDLALTGCTLEAVVVKSDSSSDTLSMLDDGLHGDSSAGDGIYGVQYSSTLMAGTYMIQVSAAGLNSAGDAFVRQARCTAKITTSGDLCVPENAVVVTPNLAAIGDSVAISGYITNLGPNNVTAFTHKIYLYSDTLDLVMIDSAEVPSGLAIGETTYVSTYFDSEGYSPGNYFIAVFADADTQVVEVDENNNVAGSPLVLESQPSLDLVISPSDIEFIPSELTPGDFVFISATVHNNSPGRAQAGRDAKEFLDGPMDQMHRAQPIEVRSSNQLSRSMKAQIRSSLQGKGSLMQDGSVDSVLVRFFHGHPDSGGSKIGQDQTIGHIGQDSSNTVGIWWYPVGLVGTQVVYVEVDGDQQVLEINEDNNIAGKSIFIDSTGIDLEIQPRDISFKPSRVIVGDTVEISCWIHNIGARDAGSPPDGENPGEVLTSLFRLHPDPVGEDSKKFMTIRKAVNAEPLMDGSGTERTEPWSQDRTAAEIPLESANQPAQSPDRTPNGKGGLISVRFYHENPDSGGTQIDADQIIVHLPSADSQEVSVVWETADLELGAHTIYVLVDPENQIPETDEFNNAAHCTVEVFEMVCGDVNRDGVVNSADVVCLINYLFKDGPAPDPLEAGDVNQDEVINSADVVYLINYLFKGGPPPCQEKQGPLTKVKPASAEVTISVAKMDRRGATILVEGEFDVDVAAMQLEGEWDEGKLQLSEVSQTTRTQKLGLYHNNGKDGKLKVGLVDISGKECISAGKGALLQLNIRPKEDSLDLSTFKIKQIILVDLNAREFAVKIVNKIGETNLPKEFSLSQNYPNPFNPQTVIQYALPHDCEVQITIYNILGQKVRTLVNEYQEAGYKRVVWDSRNDTGEEVASGIYFYKIKAGEFTDSKKMVILK